MASTVDISRVRILEIGSSYFKLEYPEQTTSLWSMPRLPQEGEPIDGFSTPDRMWRELRAARDGRYDVIVVNTLRYSPWHPRYWGRAPFYTPHQPWASLSRPFGVSVLRFAKAPVPLIAIDMDDAFGIGRSSVFLLDKARIFFKRELPVDKWQVLYGTVHPHLPTLRYRNSERWRRRMDALQPISLPQFRHSDRWRSAPFPEKTHDIFFSGAILGNSTVRSAGLAELERLKAQRLSHRPARGAAALRSFSRTHVALVAGVVAGRHGLGLQPPLRGGDHPGGAADEPSDHHPACAAAGRRARPLLRRRAGWPERAAVAALADRQRLQRMCALRRVTTCSRITSRQRLLRAHPASAALDARFD